MVRPLIGITTRVISVAGLGKVPAGIEGAVLWGVFSDYCESVSAAGGTPVMLARSSDPREIISHLDGLVLSGGEDVHPSRYGQQPEATAGAHDLARDEFELDLALEALNQRVPILAICRGCQLINVALGGTLVQDLPPVDGFSHADAEEYRGNHRHLIEVAPGSLLGEVLAHELDGSCRVGVNSYHHQAIDTTGVGLLVTARAPDGTIEAVESTDGFVLAVQWHPEMYEGVDPVFTWLINEATVAHERT